MTSSRFASKCTDQHVNFLRILFLKIDQNLLFFIDQQKVNREVSLVLKHGVEAKNYEDLAKAEKLKPLEVELRRLEDLSDSIVQDFAYMRKREEEMRDTNGTFKKSARLKFSKKANFKLF